MSAGMTDRRYAERMPLAERRAQLLESARRLASEEGLGAINMESVARAAGVTKPVVYASFANAEALIDALLEQEGRRVFTQARELIPEATDRVDPLELARDGVVAFLGLVRSDVDTWRILLAVEGFPPSARSGRDRLRRRLHRDLSGILEWGMAQRPGGPLDAELLAHLLMSGLEGAARLVVEDPETWSDERLGAFATEVMRGVWSG